ncbi:MAG: hypothetical protein HYS12_28525 [Planctomycetes bacterium]|nr:hypothetical protein [Planctomycetota bacterium]
MSRHALRSKESAGGKREIHDAIDYLIANHAQMQQDTERSAIRIEH